MRSGSEKEFVTRALHEMSRFAQTGYVSQTSPTWGWGVGYIARNVLLGIV